MRRSGRRRSRIAVMCWRAPIRRRSLPPRRMWVRRGLGRRLTVMATPDSTPSPPFDHMPRHEPVTFESGWQRRFRNFAESKDDDAGIAGWSPNGLACRLRNFSRLWRDGDPEGAWLDAGCGAGTYCRFLAAKNLRVLGVDYSLPTLRKAERRGSQGIVWALGDVTRLPVKTGAYSGALCFGVLQALSTSDA